MKIWNMKLRISLGYALSKKRIVFAMLYTLYTASAVV